MPQDVRNLLHRRERQPMKLYMRPRSLTPKRTV